MTNVSKIAKQLGKLGGDKTKANMPADHYKNISKIAHAKRWGDKRKEKPEAPKIINGFKTCPHGVILSIGICKKGCR